MNRRNLAIFFGVVLFLIGACSLPSSTFQGAPQSSSPSNGTTQANPQPSSPQASESFSEIETLAGSLGKLGQGATQAPAQESIPLAPNSKYDPESSASSEGFSDPSGSFMINSQSSIDSLVQYYADALPKQGWTLRYTDANFKGGVTQYWKKDNLYLSLDFGFEDQQLVIHAQYQRVEAQAAQDLPAVFPLPDQAEMVDATDQSWEFYIPQNYTAVTNFYIQKNWIQTPTPAGGEGECGDTDCVTIPTYPAGVTPMPTATFDSRSSNNLSIIMPDGNQMDLTITPHQNGTILDVQLILKNVASAGLPKDVPIYPGATAASITTGSVEFQVNADVKTIENYYIDQLKAAGWSPSFSTETLTAWVQDDEKGDQKITISVTSNGADASYLVIDCSTCRH